MNRRNTVITEDELTWIHRVVDDWLFADDIYHLGNQDYRDEVMKLKNSLPLPDNEMEWEE